MIQKIFLPAGQGPATWRAASWPGSPPACPSRN